MSFLQRVAKFFLPDARQQALLIYKELHEQARNEWFFTALRVPDTLEGRFEVLVLHVFLWINRMQQDPDYETAYRPVTENLLEILFDDLDSALREMGVGDTGVPRRIKAMGEALYGRIEAYEKALESKEAVHEAIQRNVYGGQGDSHDVNRLQLYLGHIADYLDSCSTGLLAQGTLELPSPEAMVE